MGGHRAGKLHEDLEKIQLVPPSHPAESLATSYPTGRPIPAGLQMARSHIDPRQVADMLEPSDQLSGPDRIVPRPSGHQAID
jgi:hypothetical protein